MSFFLQVWDGFDGAGEINGKYIVFVLCPSKTMTCTADYISKLNCGPLEVVDFFFHLW